uniref:Glycosyltransferase family 2 protein n=1 Tax=Panagrellus redivivus TaxID=6233 RepID=A0A7E4VUQ8_PANRE
MSFFKYGNEDFVFSKLPYTFQRRLIHLASEQEKFDCYSSLFITDNYGAYPPASRAVCKEREYDCIQYFEDGPLTFSPTWQSVLLVDDILDKRKPLFINDTLILHLKYTRYSQFKSLIFGSYSRLVLYGGLIRSYHRWTWDEVKILMHDKVKQVRIMNVIEVNPKDYDDVVNFVLRFGRDVDCKLV